VSTNVALVSPSDQFVRALLRQERIDHGELIRWTKGFNSSNTEGRDVAEMFRKSLEKYVRPFPFAICFCFIFIGFTPETAEITSQAYSNHQ